MARTRSQSAGKRTEVTKANDICDTNACNQISRVERGRQKTRRKSVDRRHRSSDRENKALSENPGMALALSPINFNAGTIVGDDIEAHAVMSFKKFACKDSKESEKGISDSVQGLVDVCTPTGEEGSKIESAQSPDASEFTEGLSSCTGGNSVDESRAVIWSNAVFSADRSRDSNKIDKCVITENQKDGFPVGTKSSVSWSSVSGGSLNHGMAQGTKENGTDWWCTPMARNRGVESMNSAESSAFTSKMSFSIETGKGGSGIGGKMRHMTSDVANESKNTAFSLSGAWQQGSEIRSNGDSKHVQKCSNLHGDAAEIELQEEEIEKEIALLTQRLAELRARREARQQRANRALSCPPTPISVSKSRQTMDDVVESSPANRTRKGRVVSAKFLQWQSKNPIAVEPKSAERKLASAKKDQPITPSIQKRGTSLGNVWPSVAKENVKKSDVPSLSEGNKPEINSKGRTDRLLQGLGSRSCSRNMVGFKKGNGLDAEPMKCSILSPTVGWNGMKTCRTGEAENPINRQDLDSAQDGKMVSGDACPKNPEQKKKVHIQDDDVKMLGQPSSKCTEELQLLANLRQNKAACTPVLRKARSVASRYCEGVVHSANGKNNSKGFEQVETPSDKRSTAKNRKRSSPDDAQHMKTVEKRSTGPWSAKKRTSSISSSHRCDLISGNLAKCNTSDFAQNQDDACTPVQVIATGLVRLELERKQLPKISIIRGIEASPRDSGCIKRETQRRNKCGYFVAEKEMEAISMDMECCNIHD